MNKDWIGMLSVSHLGQCNEINGTTNGSSGISFSNQIVLVSICKRTTLRPCKNCGKNTHFPQH